VIDLSAFFLPLRALSALRLEEYRRLLLTRALLSLFEIELIIV